VTAYPGKTWPWRCPLTAGSEVLISGKPIEQTRTHDWLCGRYVVGCAPASYQLSRARAMTDEFADSLPVRLRWEKDSRYYEIHLQQDLWGDWVLTRIWGRRGSPAGQITRVPCRSYRDAAALLASVCSQRKRRGYEPVSL
jgi:predicted DNA-binding WGR domain protein